MAARKAVAEPTPINFADALAGYYVRELDSIDKKLRLRPGAEFSLDPISTGCLAADWVLSGGARPAFNQVAGFEQAGKTTITVGVLGGAVKAQVPLIGFSDPEGTLTPEYADAVLNSFGLDDVFDQVRRRYYSTNVLEDVTNQLARLVRRLPDKVWSDEVGMWCYFVPKSHQAWTNVINTLKDAGLKADKGASTDAFWAYPTEYTGPEAAWFIDSWAALTPEAVDEIIEKEKDSGAGMAIFARTMAEELPKFAGRLKRKGVVLWAVNQLREAPMALPPVKEYGGNALKNFSTVRNQMQTRAVPEGFDRDPQASNLCIEESVSGNGYDRYAFKDIKNTKNKLGRPFLKTMMRVWVADEFGEPHGYDPVYDTWQYLLDTKQVSGGRKKGFTLKLKPSIKGNATALNGIQFNWMTFKQLILAEHFNDRESLKEVAAQIGITKAPRLRDRLFEQVKSDKTLWGESASEAASEDNNNDDDE